MRILDKIHIEILEFVDFVAAILENGIFRDFPLELNFNFLRHVITHLYEHIGEEIVW